MQWHPPLPRLQAFEQCQSCPCTRCRLISAGARTCGYKAAERSSSVEVSLLAEVAQEQQISPVIAENNQNRLANGVCKQY